MKYARAIECDLFTFLFFFPFRFGIHFLFYFPSFSIVLKSRVVTHKPHLNRQTEDNWYVIESKDSRFPSSFSFSLFMIWRWIFTNNSLFLFFLFYFLGKKLHCLEICNWRSQAACEKERKIYSFFFIDVCYRIRK